MKKVLLLAVMIFGSISVMLSQDKLSYEKVIVADSVSKQSIYNGIKEWIGMNFVSAKNVIQVDDKDAGLIIITSVTPYNSGKLSHIAYVGELSYTIKIQIKDNRFKVEFTNFVHKSYSDIRPDYWSLGMLTTSEEYQGKCSSLEKSRFNKVWTDLKMKSDLIYKDLVSSIGNVQFKSSKDKGGNDNW